MLHQNGERLMPYKQRNGFGRYWTAETFGIQNMSCRIRHTICKDSMVDIDMKNAHQHCFPGTATNTGSNVKPSTNTSNPGNQCCRTWLIAVTSPGMKQKSFYQQ